MVEVYGWLESSINISMPVFLHLITEMCKHCNYTSFIGLGHFAWTKHLQILRCEKSTFTPKNWRASARCHAVPHRTAGRAPGVILMCIYITLFLSRCAHHFCFSGAKALLNCIDSARFGISFGSYLYLPSVEGCLVRGLHAGLITLLREGI